jgi:hypothetical protein
VEYFILSRIVVLSMTAEGKAGNQDHPDVLVGATSIPEAYGQNGILHRPLEVGNKKGKNEFRRNLVDIHHLFEFKHHCGKI